MYCPSQFAMQDPAMLAAFCRQFPFATLSWCGADSSQSQAEGPAEAQMQAQLQAEHLPLLWQSQSAQAPNADAQNAGEPLLLGHVARGNPLCQLTPGTELLAIFHGPSHYISPQWYASKIDNPKVVPTWNYLVVHARVRLQRFCTDDELLAMLRALTALHESAVAAPGWQLEDAPAPFIRQLCRAIVGLQLEILSLQGKWKVSQNQPLLNQQSVAAALAQRATAADSDAARMAAWVRHFIAPA